MVRPIIEGAWLRLPDGNLFIGMDNRVYLSAAAKEPDNQVRRMWPVTLRDVYSGKECDTWVTAKPILAGHSKAE